jgi:hypothetical protein
MPQQSILTCELHPVAFRWWIGGDEERESRTKKGNETREPLTVYGTALFGRYHASQPTCGLPSHNENRRGSSTKIVAAS